MTEEKLEQAKIYLSRVRHSEVKLNRLGVYIPNRTSVALEIGDNHINLDPELEEQIVKLATDYYEKKKAECQQKFDAL